MGHSTETELNPLRLFQRFLCKNQCGFVDMKIDEYQNILLLIQFWLVQFSSKFLVHRKNEIPFVADSGSQNQAILQYLIFIDSGKDFLSNKNIYNKIGKLLVFIRWRELVRYLPYFVALTGSHSHNLLNKRIQPIKAPLAERPPVLLLFKFRQERFRWRVGHKNIQAALKFSRNFRNLHSPEKQDEIILILLLNSLYDGLPVKGNLKVFKGARTRFICRQTLDLSYISLILSRDAACAHFPSSYFNVPIKKRFDKCLNCFMNFVQESFFLNLVIEQQKLNLSPATQTRKLKMSAK